MCHRKRARVSLRFQFTFKSTSHIHRHAMKISQYSLTSLDIHKTVSKVHIFIPSVFVRTQAIIKRNLFVPSHLLAVGIVDRLVFYLFSRPLCCLLASPFHLFAYVSAGTVDGKAVCVVARFSFQAATVAIRQVNKTRAHIVVSPDFNNNFLFGCENFKSF